MKKVLFATTALVGSAGIAAADVSLTGMAEMGIVGGTALANVQFHTDIDVFFTMSGETDHGVTFGAVVDLDENAAFANTTQGGETIFVKGSFGTLTMGDTDGAFDWALTEVDMVGSINDDHTAHAGFNGNGGFDGSNDGQVARYDYAFGDFAFALSAEIDDNAAPAPGVNSVVYGVGVKYSTSMSGMKLGVGLGYQGFTNASIWGASLSAGMDNGISAVLNYSASSGTAVVDTTHWGIGLGYAMDAFAVHANYGSYTRAGANNDTSGFGVAASYDLGGGMKLHAGYGNSNNAGPGANTDTYSFGAAMSF